MTENGDMGFKADLLETVLEVIHGQRGQNTSELVSLLALSNLLGIISFLNTQDINFNMKGSSSNTGMPELKDLAANLLGSMGGSGDNKKINPATLLNLMKTLSASDNSGENKTEKKTTENNTKSNR